MNSLNIYRNKNINYNNKKYIPLNNGITGYQLGLNKKQKYICAIFIFIVFIIFIYLHSKNKVQLYNNLFNKRLDLKDNEYQFLLKLKRILDNNEILENEMMYKHTTFKLGGPAKLFIIPSSINKIIKVIHLCKEYQIEYFILGNGSNLLVSDEGYNGIIINIHENNFSNLKIKQVNQNIYHITVGGGMLMRNLAIKMCLLSLSGLEDIIDIPGTIGGGIIMNASAGGKGLIIDSLLKVKIITPDGEIKELSKKECELRGRGSLLKDRKYMVIEGTFNMIKFDKLLIQKRMADHTSLRYSRQPMYFPSAGSFFIWWKPKFGSLYDKYKESNLVGYKIGDAMIYTHNIAFIVNLGNAKSSDVYKIVLHVEKTIKKNYNINIKREVVVIGAFSDY